MLTITRPAAKTLLEKAAASWKQLRRSMVMIPPELIDGAEQCTTIPWVISGMRVLTASWPPCVSWKQTTSNR